MSVQFDPERLDRRRRRVEPAVIGAIVVAVGILAAIAKPWDSLQALQPVESQAVVTATEPPASPTQSPRPPEAGPDWTALTTVVTKHDAWGVTAVLRHGPAATGATATPPPYTELWTPTATDASGSDTAVLTRGGAEIAALSITAPDAVRLKAVRLWRLHQSNQLEWINAATIDDEATSQAPLLVRTPLLDGVDPVPWDAGQYRADVLTDDGIHRIAVVVAKQFGDVSGPDDWPAGAPDTVAATATDPSGIQHGLFATVDGTAVSIPALESGVLGEAQAWGDTAVAPAYIPRATGLGVMLTSHADVKGASISRLTPEPLSDPPEPLGGISNLRGRTPYVVFPAPGDGVWTPGVYEVTVDWKDAAGAHHGAWHVELRPGVG